jgi:hypothetical protein
VLDKGPYPEHFTIEIAVAASVAQLVGVWGLLGVGVWRLWRKYGVLMLALASTLVLFVLAVALTNALDARYLLPFAPFVYLGQAVGLAWIAETLACRDHTKRQMGATHSPTV